MAIKCFSKFTQRQFLTLVVIGIVNFCLTLCISLQAPFYPREAEKKGATASEYGFVFGIYELVVFIASPIFGKNIKSIGPKLLFNGGLITTGVCVILFGFLDRVKDHYWFISLSLVIRVLEALGTSAFFTSGVGIVATEFPENASSVFASLETCFGLGFILGPIVGGALYQVGGYTVPFASLGGVLLFFAVTTQFILPSQNRKAVDKIYKGGLLGILMIPGVLIALSVTAMTSVANGFLSATLEPHLRQFGLSPLSLGLMFVINGGTYAVTAPIWGWACDKHIHPKVVLIFGCILQILAYSLIGPAPFIPIDTCLSITIVGLIFQGFGTGAGYIASFADAMRTTESYGCTSGIETFGVLSSLYSSAFALGGFIGPSISGLLLDSYGFRTGSLFVVAVIFVVGVVVYFFWIFSRPRPMYTEIEHNSETQSNASLEGSTVSVFSERSSLMDTTVREKITFENLPNQLPKEAGWRRREYAPVSSSASYSSSDHYRP